MNIFISHPMTGLTKEQILDLRSKAVNKITELYDNCTFIDSYLSQFQDTDTPLLALAECIKLLHKADLVVFITYSNTSYKNSKGCQVEELICKLYKKQIEYLNL